MTYDAAPDVITPSYEMRPATADTLRSRVDLYDSVIRVTNYHADTSTTRLVDPEELAGAFTNRHRPTSPLLPENALWWSNSSYGAAIAMWEPPRIRRVAMSMRVLEVPERLDIPMPGLLYVCVPGKPPWIFASPERPESPEQRLYHAPTFNTFTDGSTCPGSNQYPLRHEQIPESFWQSFFTLAGDSRNRSRKHYDNLWNLWQELNDQPQYPEDDLIPTINVAQAMRLP